MKPMNVGLLGVGSVGGGTYNVLKRNREEIARRAGREIKVRAVASRTHEKIRQLVGDEVEILKDPEQLVTHPNIDIVVELIGGIRVAGRAAQRRWPKPSLPTALLALPAMTICAAAQKRCHGLFEAGGRFLYQGIARRTLRNASVLPGSSWYSLHLVRDARGRQFRRC
jgi:homoserine dehydrogenase